MRPETAHRLATLNKVQEPKMCELIVDFIKHSEIEPGKAEIYREFSTRKGNQKPHLSALSEGDEVRRSEGVRNSRKTKARIYSMRWH